MSPKSDLDREATFYDPHPGFAGAAIPIPAEVRRVAETLDGATMTLAEAIAKLAAVSEGEVRDVPEHRYVCLHLKERSGREHLFRVIRYREKTGS